MYGEPQRMNFRYFFEDATSLEAQLALSYLVWPEQAPDPRVVDDWIRRSDRLPAAGGLIPDQDPEGEYPQCHPAEEDHADEDECRDPTQQPSND